MERTAPADTTRAGKNKLSNPRAEAYTKFSHEEAMHVEFEKVSLQELPLRSCKSRLGVSCHQTTLSSSTPRRQSGTA